MAKNVEAQSWDEWIKANAAGGDPTTLKPIPAHREYLENRLRAAFLDGMAKGREAERAEITKRLQQIVLGKGE